MLHAGPVSIRSEAQVPNKCKVCIAVGDKVAWSQIELDELGPDPDQKDFVCALTKKSWWGTPCSSHVVTPSPDLHAKHDQVQ